MSTSRNELCFAQPNAGYLVAAALLGEGVLAAVLTLNFDLALTHALGALSATDVSLVPGPQAADQLGQATVIYLHRSVEELDLERWILTVEALETEWHNRWEEVVARRVMSCPVVIFAGLGSHAAVLTETVTRVRHALDPNQHQVYVVDPAEATQFEAALDLTADAHLRTGWSAFMEKIAHRLLAECSSDLEAAGRVLCAGHSWTDEAAHLAALCDRLHSVGLVALGKIRAKWLLENQQYTPDDARRPLIADLLLGVGLVERATDLQARFREDGVVELVRDGVVATCVLISSVAWPIRCESMRHEITSKAQRVPLAAASLRRT